MKLRVINELSRRTPYAIITAHRNTNSKRQNNARNRALRGILDSRFTNVQPVIGHWHGTTEYSYRVTKPPDMPLDKFSEFMVDIARTYEQDAFTLHDGTNTTLIRT